MTLKRHYFATYRYPGAFLSEEVTRELEEPSLEAALACQPTDAGYFTKDGWYAVVLESRVDKLFKADDGEETWVMQGLEKIGSFIVGDLVHVTDESIAGEEFRVLRANIEGNSRGNLKGYAVRTRLGNYQIASDYDWVIPEKEALR